QALVGQDASDGRLDVRAARLGVRMSGAREPGLGPPGASCGDGRLSSLARRLLVPRLALRPGEGTRNGRPRSRKL
ncbi:MAG: FIG038982: hypothetical protein, partial [uncultured Rubrobacteraceae bacterium]